MSDEGGVLFPGFTVSWPELFGPPVPDADGSGRMIERSLVLGDYGVEELSDLERSLLLIMVDHVHEVCEFLTFADGVRVFEPHPMDESGRWEDESRHWEPLVAMCRQLAKAMVSQLPRFDPKNDWRQAVSETEGVPV